MKGLSLFPIPKHASEDSQVMLGLQRRFSITCPVQDLVIPEGSLWKYNTKRNYQYIIGTLQIPRVRLKSFQNKHNKLFLYMYMSVSYFF